MVAGEEQYVGMGGEGGRGDIPVGQLCTTLEK
jgi:hypothetical protein